LGKIFQDLWIMSEEAIVLFSRVFDPKVDDQLFGGLMSALNTFAESLSDGGLSHFELSDKRFALMKMNKLLFVANASLTVKDKKLLGEIQKVAEKFFTKYPENFIRDWN